MKRVLISQLVVLVLVIAGTGCAQDPAVEQAAADAANEVVATFAGGQITAGELEGLAGAAVIKLKQQIYEAKAQSLERAIFDRLVTAEAAKLGISNEEYMKLNVTVETPPDEDITRVTAQFRSRLPKDDDKARTQVVNYLSQQGQQRASQALQKKLFGQAGVKIMLEPPRVEATVQAFNATRGPADAPVTIFEYTDFQCLYCTRAQQTIDAVRERYGDSVRHVFKNLPLPMHKQAHQAAEASMCAADQGKFWEMHDWMFANASSLGKEQLVAQAKELGLDEAAFTTCLDEKIHAADVDQDMREAQQFGITGTPGFVINGRILTGAQPVDAFVKLIDDELARLGLPIPEEPAPDVADSKGPKMKIKTQQTPPENAK